MSKTDFLYRELKKLLIPLEPESPFLPTRSIMEKFGVSQATVSSAIQRLVDEGLLRRNGRRNAIVTSEVLRYRRGAKPVFSLTLPLWYSEYYNVLEQAFVELAEELDYEPEIFRYDRRLRVPDTLPPSKTDGLIIVGGNILEENISTLNSLGVPYAIFGQQFPAANVSSLNGDNEYLGTLAAHHLWKLGHRKLAVACTERPSALMYGRNKGFLQFAELHGCAVEEIDCAVREGDFSLEKVYRVLNERFRNGKPDFTGIYLMSEAGSYGVCRAAYEHGIRIPDDLSVVTTGESPYLDFMIPALTSVGTDLKAQMRTMIEVLRNEINGKKEQRTFKAQLFLRASTKRLSEATVK